MAKPRVFVSSTYYDLKQVRSDLERFINDQGYDAVLNEKGHISYGSQEKLEEYCYKEIDQCDILISIIGGRYGSKSQETEYSVSNKELKKALETGKQVYIFIESSVATEYRTYEVNKGTEGMNYAAVDDVKVYQFLEEVYELPKNNTIHSFSSAQDIANFLKEQWAGLFQRLLSDESKKKEFNLITKLSQTSETLNQLVEFLIDEKKNGESAIAQILTKNHPAFNQIEKQLKVPFRVFFETGEELADILEHLGFKKIKDHEFDARKEYLSWHFPGSVSEIFRVSKEIFETVEDVSNLKVITPSEWKTDFIMKDTAIPF